MREQLRKCGFLGISLLLLWGGLHGACAPVGGAEKAPGDAGPISDQARADLPLSPKEQVGQESITPDQPAPADRVAPTDQASEPPTPDAAPDARAEAPGPDAGQESVPEPTPEPPPERTLPDQPAPTSLCAPLPAATGTIVQVTPQQAAQLPKIVAAAKAGTTILLADGVYKMTGNESARRINFRTPRVTLRSASGDPAKVIIDGEYKTEEMLFINADDITIAAITIRRAKYHLIHVTGKPGHTQRTKMYRLRLLDGGQQFVKVNSSNGGKEWADNGTLACSTLEMTAAGRPNIESRFGGCYTGGIDAHGAWNWIVRYNTFKGIYCTNGKLAEHAVHFWRVSRGTLVERNIIINCARGIGFGLGQSTSSGDRKYANDPYPNVSPKGHIDGIIRNNLIHTDPAVQKYYDTGIELEQAYNAVVVHNTAASKATFTGLSYRFANTKATIRNNLLYGLRLRNGAKGTVSNNLAPTPLGYFVDAPNINYHLEISATKAIGQGIVVPQAGLDLDGKPHRKPKPDLGAYAQ